MNSKLLIVFLFFALPCRLMSQNCGLYKTSADFTSNNLLNPSSDQYESSFNFYKVSGVKFKLGKDNPYWGAKIMGSKCRFYQKWRCDIILTGPICIYTIHDIPEFDFNTDGKQVTSYTYCSNASLLVSKGLDGEIKKIWNDKDIAAFLAEDPKLLQKFMNDDTQYKGGSIVTRWIRFINCILEYNSRKK